MSNIEPGRRNRPSRRARADRAYNLVRVTGGLLVLTIVLLVLAVIGAVSGGWVVVAGALTVGAGLVLRRSMR
jgi:hypothetical protein